MKRKFKGGELVIATHNRGKLAEFLDMMGENAPALSTAADYGLSAPAEIGHTFTDNAKIKALFVAQQTGKISLADDSGLCVAALGGDPGLYSADWAGEPRDFSRAIDRVLKEMGDAADRTAEFVSVLVLAWPDGHCEVAEGVVKGRIVNPRGEGGHGYDPIFQPEGYDATYAEMPSALKNKISHRAVAFRKMMDLCFR